MLQCKQCSIGFKVTDSDRQFYKQMEVPEPTLCPDCRMQRLLAFRHNRKLYHRPSSKTGQSLISVHRPDAPYPVYSVSEWWADDWDGTDFGREFDFNRSFFDQFSELYQVVPKMANMNAKSENCEYSNSVGNSKNVYFSFKVYRSEDIYYSEQCTQYNHHIFNSSLCFKSDHLNDCVDCHDCHSSQNLFKCQNCRDSYFSIDCQGCSEIIFCTNLRNKSYCIENQQLTKGDYEKRKKGILDGRYSTHLKNLERFRAIWLKKFWSATTQINCENCTGNNLYNSKNAQFCFDCNNLQNAKYVWDATPSEVTSNAMDMGSVGIGDWLYYSSSLGGGNYFMRFCFLCRYCAHLTYSADCYTCEDCFGCTGLRNKKYCILNKQYSEADYKKLVLKIIEHMKKTREWGEFFPARFSPSGYNETIAQEAFPLTKEQALRQGFNWTDENDIQRMPATYELPDSLHDVSDAITKAILACVDCGRNYKIIPQELKFYRENNISIPCQCPFCRFETRFKMRNPRKLFNRNCAKCKITIQTTYSPDRPEVVYCEKCYIQSVY